MAWRFDARAGIAHRVGTTVVTPDDLDSTPSVADLPRYLMVHGAEGCAGQSIG